MHLRRPSGADQRLLDDMEVYVLLLTTYLPQVELIAQSKEALTSCRNSENSAEIGGSWRQRL